MLRFFGIAIAVSLGAAIPANEKAVLDHITAADLKGNLSFLASDTLQGRYTPSPGLEVAAEFIASRFREAGLEPGGDQEYFQMAPMVDRRMPRFESVLTVENGPETVTVPAGAITITAANQAVKIEGAPAVFLDGKSAAQLKGLDLNGKAVIAPQPDLDSLSSAERRAAYRKVRAFDAAIAESNAAIEISVARHPGRRLAGPRLLPLEETQEHRVPALNIESESLARLVDRAPKGNVRVSVEVPAPDDQKVVVKNVIGILRGSDPVLKSTCVLLTAHYDHIGTTDTAGRMAMSSPKNSSDHIYNGANDDGSGTVSVIEIARAIATLKLHPKRSIVFMTFFGEERGELGSQFYGRHPVFPIDKTVADLNLEQVGRTDSTEGKELSNASLTGYDYSDLTKFFEEAGRETGIKVYKDSEASDAYFTRSDNAALAEQGVPAHTLTTAFDYPDYHGLGDEWQKIDYENMAKVDGMVALALLDVANSAKAPEWNAENPKTAPFRKAQEKSRQR
ncbi:MAG TPA: M28 family peptidase [Bryobacteraceae bacterium]